MKAKAPGRFEMLALVFSLFSSLPALGSEVAITLDDFSIKNTAPLSIEQRDQRILDALSDHEVKAAAFVTCEVLENKRIRRRLDIWNAKGHLIANHTHSHWNYHKTSFDKFVNDVLKCDNMLKGLAHFKKVFRFPFLKGGDSKEKRDQIQGFLKEHGYKNGYVTIDASDWYISSRLESRLRQDPRADTRPYRDYYLSHMWERARYYDELAKKYWRKPVKHTLIIHHNLLNSMFLADLLKMFREKGWKLIDAQSAFDDLIFEAEPDVVPSGESILWSLAKAAGDDTLRQPGEDGAYEKAKMDELGL